MNTGKDKMSLIDITTENDLLIDSQFDRASFDIRLSTSNAVKREVFKSRQSLAWDNAFFTNEGILDLRELSLVNEGFKNPEDQTSKTCEKRRLPCRLVRREGEASKSFLDFRVGRKHNLQPSKNNTREPKTNISLNSQTRSSAQKQDHHLRLPKVQTGAPGHVTSTAKSPRSAYSKNVSSVYTGNVSSSAGKRWFSKSLDFKGENGKKISGGLDANGTFSPHKLGDAAQMWSSMKQNGAKAKRSLSPLPGDVMNSSKKDSKICTPSQRFRFFEIENSATQSATRVPILQGISPEPSGLKKGERKTNSQSLAKKARPVDKDEQKENVFHVKSEGFHTGLAKEKYVEITNLFDGLAIEPKGIKSKKASNSRLLGSASKVRAENQAISCCGRQRFCIDKKCFHVSSLKDQGASDALIRSDQLISQGSRID